MTTEGLPAVIARLVAELPSTLVDAVLAQLERLEVPIRNGDLVGLTVVPHSRRLLADLEGQLVTNPLFDGQLVAVAIRSCALAAANALRRNSLEIAWTGPGTSLVPVRRVDQVMYEMVADSQRSVLLVSYVAYGADRLIMELSRASSRGVEVSLVLERAEDTNGRLEFDGLKSIQARLSGVAIYHWPRERRQLSRQGKSGLLHAKCLVCDDRRLLVSSANLTDYALELNMELGLLITGDDAPARIAGHFRQLILQGDLQLVD